MSLVFWRENEYFEKRERVLQRTWRVDAGTLLKQPLLAEVFKHCCALHHCYTKAVSYAGSIKVASEVDPTIYCTATRVNMQVCCSHAFRKGSGNVVFPP